MEGYSLMDTAVTDAKFVENMKDYIVIVVTNDNTVNIRTSTRDLEELQAIFSSAYLMVASHDVKTEEASVDKLH
jgi:hypothetical protein